MPNSTKSKSLAKDAHQKKMESFNGQQTLSIKGKNNLDNQMYHFKKKSIELALNVQMIKHDHQRHL